MCWRSRASNPTSLKVQEAQSLTRHMTCLLSTIWSLSLHLFGPAMIGPTGFRSSPAAAFLGIAMVQSKRNDDLPWSHTHIQNTCDLGNLHCKSQSHHPGSACHHVLHPLASNHLKRFGLLVGSKYPTTTNKKNTTSLDEVPPNHQSFDPYTAPLLQAFEPLEVQWRYLDPGDEHQKKAQGKAS